MNALMIEAVPARPLASLAEAFEILLPVVGGHVVLSGNIKNLLWPGTLEHLGNGVELARFRKMAEVAGVNDQIGLNRQGVDLVNGGLQGCRNIVVGGLIEADM